MNLKNFDVHVLVLFLEVKFGLLYVSGGGGACLYLVEDLHPSVGIISVLSFCHWCTAIRCEGWTEGLFEQKALYQPRVH